MRTLLAALIGLGLVFSALPSQAADLAVRGPYKAPTPAPVYVPVLNPWAGFYGGLNGGYAWEGFGGDIPSISTGDGFFGGQIGYNWTSGSWLYGLEGDLQGTTGHVGTSSGTCTGVSCSANARINGFGTIRGRLGMTFGSGLAYLTGGAAFVSTGAQMFTAVGNAENKGEWNVGYTIGAGYEQMLWSRWSGKLEYLYLAADGPSLTVGGVTASTDIRAHILRAGLNYHF